MAGPKQQVHLTLTLDKVFLRAGPVARTFPVAGQVRPAKPWDRLTRFGVLLSWPKDLGWLSVAASFDGGGPPAAAFAATAAGLDEACAAHAVRRDQLAPPKFLEGVSFLVASLPQANRVFLSVEVDTDADGFRKAVRERWNEAKKEFVQPFHLWFFDAKQFGTFVSQPGQVDLVMKPCTPLPRFAGVLAADLGNTSTTAAALAVGDPVYRTDSVRMVPLDGGGEPAKTAAPMPSVVRLDRVTSFGPVPEGTRRFPGLPGDDRADAVLFAAGALVAAGGGADGELPPGVVYGAKHLLAAKEDGSAGGHQTLVVPHERPGGGPAVSEAVEVLDRAPGELLFAHAVRRFRRGASAWPADLTLTYPTTYGPREVKQLVRAAARGWLRAHGQPQGFDAPPEPTGDADLDRLGAELRQWLADPAAPAADCPLVGLTLDEATAAAFFHLHRRAFELPGGLLRFRYLHPGGLRLLLVDCGGGTTDVVLVHALSRPDGPPLLEIDVLARTGARGFGGDQITRAACRLAKAKIALALARLRTPAAVPAGLQPPPPTSPPTPAQARKAVDDFLDKVRGLDPHDELVPTTFDPRAADPATQLRRSAAHALWQLGDDLKRRLGAGKPVRLKDLDAARTGKDTSPLVAAAVRPLAPAQVPQALGQIGEVSVAPWEVDALVRPAVDAVVKKCNNLIRKHLVDRPGGEVEVDWVVVSGNGAKYPLVSKSLVDGLHVAYAAERLTVDAENLKEAVAKGAAMARMVERVPRAVGVKFNRHLSELLPFDVGYHDMLTNAPVPLFKEYTPYSELAAAPRRVRLVPAGGGVAAGHTFVLERRFPGDDEYSRYASYSFVQGISGELEVAYNPATGEFDVTDTTTGEPGAFADLMGVDALAPVMRGDL